MKPTAPTRIEFHSGLDGSVVTFGPPVRIATHALQGHPVTVEVVPPPGSDGLLPSRDGRRQRVPDIRALAERLNRQEIMARVDRDHQSEPVSKTFTGSTEASGWLSRYRVNVRGGIDADMELIGELRETLRKGQYKYVSPAYHVGADGTVMGLSSLALVNNPNLPLDAPVLHAAQARAAAAEVVDAAIASGRVPARERDYHVGAIARHPGGVEQGIEAFRGYLNAHFEAVTDRHDARFMVPHGYSVGTGERLALHASASEIARSEGISYREALARCPDMPLSAGPVAGADLHAKTAYEQLKAQVETALARVAQIPAEGLMASAKLCLDIANRFADAGRWVPAIRAIQEARQYLLASDELVYEGRTRRAERMMQQTPTPDRFLVGAERYA